MIAVMYTWILALFRFVFTVFFGMKVEKVGRIPDTGPVIVIANHASTWDPPLAACASERPMHFMAKEELFHMPVFSFVLPRIRVFPVKRGTADRKAIKTALEVLYRGDILALFPEGTRSKDGVLADAEPGAAMFALRTKTPVVPVALVNSHRILKKGDRFPRLTVRVGHPVDLSEFYDAKITGDVLTKAGIKMMHALADLLPPEQKPKAEHAGRKDASNGTLSG